MNVHIQHSRHGPLLSVHISIQQRWQHRGCVTFVGIILRPHTICFYWLIIINNYIRGTSQSRTDSYIIWCLTSSTEQSNGQHWPLYWDDKTGSCTGRLHARLFCYLLFTARSSHIVCSHIIWNETHSTSNKRPKERNRLKEVHLY
jgi:hypothetical protein